MHHKVLPLKLGRLWFPKLLNASLPWEPAGAMGFSIQEIKASNSLDLQNWRRAPHSLPWLSGSPDSFPNLSKPTVSLWEQQIPYCPHGCEALHPVQAEGMQQGERGRYKQEQKQPRVSGGGMKERSSWDHYLQPLWYYKKTRMRWSTGVKPQAYAEGENPCQGAPFDEQSGSRGWDLTMATNIARIKKGNTLSLERVSSWTLHFLGKYATRRPFFYQ